MRREAPEGDQRASKRVDERTLARIRELFHGLIRSRAREGGLAVPRRLPRLGDLVVDDPEPKWFPVAGMYGGFAYRLQSRGDLVQLLTESGSRVADGSGMMHVVTAMQVVLEAEGFV